jgi:HTH-type transcriptional regulator/antitoxin HipB
LKILGIIPNGKKGMNLKLIRSAEDLGQVVRWRRKAAGLTQAALAEIAGVGKRFLSELERGKPTAEFSKVLQVLSVLGLDLQLAVRPGGEK